MSTANPSQLALTPPPVIKTIQLRSLLAKDIPIVVQAGAYGDGIDGLLGMSFLSRFNINIDAKAVRISPRTADPNGSNRNR